MAYGLGNVYGSQSQGLAQSLRRMLSPNGSTTYGPPRQLSGQQNAGFWPGPTAGSAAFGQRQSAFGTQMSQPLTSGKCYDVAGREVPCVNQPPGHIFDPNAPVGSVNSGGGAVTRGPEAGTSLSVAGAIDFPGYLQDLVKAFQKAGYFDPSGNKMLIESGRQNASDIAGGVQRQAQLAAQASGMDPTQRASYWLQGLLGGQGTQARLENQSLMDAWNKQNQFAQSLALGWGGQQTLPPDKSAGPADYGLQLLLAALLKHL